MPAPTLAVISSNSNGSKFYRKLVEYFTANDRKKDQQHVPTISIYLPHKNSEQFKLKCLLAIEKGTNYIVLDEQLNKLTSDIIKELEKQYEVKFAILEENHSNADTIVKDIFSSCEKNLTPNLYSFNKRGLSNNIPSEIQEYLKDICSSPSFRRIPGVDGIVGVIGGAGPLASAQFYELLSGIGVNYIGLDDTLAPGKNDSIMYNSDKEADPKHHFLPHYQNDIKLLTENVQYLAIPCNTAHACIEKFNPTNLIKLIDIREAVVSKISLQKKNNKHNVTNQIEKVAVFGTPATIKMKLYDQKLSDLGVSFVNPNENFITKLYNIINRVKEEGDLEKIRNDFIEIVLEFRKEQGEDFWILLVCTEFSILFSEEKCVRHKLISSTHALTNWTKTTINRSSPKFIQEDPHNNAKLEEELNKLIKDSSTSKQPQTYLTPQFHVKLGDKIEIPTLDISNDSPEKDIPQTHKLRKKHTKTNSVSDTANNSQAEPYLDSKTSDKNQKTEPAKNHPTTKRRFSLHSYHYSNAIYKNNKSNSTNDVSSNATLPQIPEGKECCDNNEDRSKDNTEQKVALYQPKTKLEIYKTPKSPSKGRKRSSDSALPKQIIETDAIYGRRNSYTEQQIKGSILPANIQQSHSQSQRQK